jgi:hypothetical protein
MIRWLDFSGAPPLLIPKRLVKLWCGAIDPETGEYSDLNTQQPRTDYDRACQAAWPGRGILLLGDASVLALYSEYDEHAWDAENMILACGSWLPTQEELASAVWSDPLKWDVKDSDFLLLNSAANGTEGLRDDDFFSFQLPVGGYTIEPVPEVWTPKKVVAGLFDPDPISVQIKS